MKAEQRIAVEAEALFADFIGDLGFEFQREQLAGAKQPDFWVETPAGLVVCEVTSITKRLFADDFTSGSFDSVATVAKKLRKKSTQGREVPAGTPYVVAIYAPNWLLGDFEIRSAMFGRQMIQVRVGDDDDPGTLVHDRRTSVVLNDKRDHIGGVIAINPDAKTNTMVIYRNPFAQNPIEESMFESRSESTRWQLDFWALVG